MIRSNLFLLLRRQMVVKGQKNDVYNKNDKEIISIDNQRV